MAELNRFEGAGGTDLAWWEMGTGRLVVLLHGFLSSAAGNWIEPGIAERLVAAGFRVIAPDCRGHGASAAPTEPQAWPMDVMAADVEALIGHLDLTDYDLAGYSMGARTAVRVMVRGARPRRCVLGGMGHSGIMEAGPRAEAFEDALRNGANAADPAMGRSMDRILAARGLKREAMLGVLAAFAPTSEADLAGIPTPSLAIVGDEDHDNGSAIELARMLGKGDALSLPGDHGSLVASPAFGEAMVRFLAG